MQDVPCMPVCWHCHERGRHGACRLPARPPSPSTTCPSDLPRATGSHPSGPSAAVSNFSPLHLGSPDVLLRRDPSVTLKAGCQIAPFTVEAGQPVHSGGVGSTSWSERLCYPQAHASPLRFSPGAIDCLGSLIGSLVTAPWDAADRENLPTDPPCNSMAQDNKP